MVSTSDCNAGGLPIKSGILPLLKHTCGEVTGCHAGHQVTSPLGFKDRVSSLIYVWQRGMCYMFHEIHLWCDTCWCIGGQHGSWADLFHIPETRHWWGSNGTRTLYRLSYLCVLHNALGNVSFFCDNISCRKRGVYVIRPKMGLPLTVVPGDARLYPSQYNSRSAIVSNDYNVQTAGHM